MFGMLLLGVLCRLNFLIFYLFFISVHTNETFDCSSIGGFSLKKGKCYRFLSDIPYDIDYRDWRWSGEMCKVHFHPSSGLGIISSAEEQELVLQHFHSSEEISRKTNNYWMGFVPFKRTHNDDNIDLVGLYSTRYEYSNWVDSFNSFRRNSAIIKYCVFMSGRNELKWDIRRCGAKSRRFSPFCMIDTLRFPELIFPSIEETYTPFDPVINETCESVSFELSPPKIFQIGFNRAGTTSLHLFFKLNNISSCHWDFGIHASTMYKNWAFFEGRRDDDVDPYRINEESIIGRENRLLLDGIYNDECVFYSDMENFPQIHAYAKFYKVLDQQYPNSRFILNVRDKESWLRSRENHMEGMYINITALYHQMTHEEILQSWSNIFENHVQEVINYFSKTKKLLVFDIEQDNGSKLVDFFSDLYEDLNPKYWGHLNRSKVKKIKEKKKKEIEREK